MDLESYFKAHQSEYEKPEALHVVAIRLEENEDPAALLEKITSPDEFRKLAAQRQPAGSDPQPGGRQLARARKDPELGDVEALFALDEGQWTKQPHVGGKGRFLVLVEKKSPRGTLQLQEVLDRVRGDYTARKQQEMVEKLFADLGQRYEVRILPDAVKSGDEKPAGGQVKAESNDR